MSSHWGFRRWEKRAKTPPPFIQNNVTLLRSLIFGRPARSPSVPAKVKRIVDLFSPEESVPAKRKSSKGRTKEDIFNSIASMLSSVSDCIDDLLSNISEIIDKESSRKSESGKENHQMGTIVSRQGYKCVAKFEREKYFNSIKSTSGFRVQDNPRDISEINKNHRVSNIDPDHYKIVNGVLCLKTRKKIKVKKHLRVRKLRDY